MTENPPGLLTNLRCRDKALMDLNASGFPRLPNPIRGDSRKMRTCRLDVIDH
jgi:hypothetical protein